MIRSCYRRKTHIDDGGKGRTKRLKRAAKIQKALLEKEKNGSTESALSDDNAVARSDADDEELDEHSEGKVTMAKGKRKGKATAKESVSAIGGVRKKSAAVKTGSKSESKPSLTSKVKPADANPTATASATSKKKKTQLVYEEMSDSSSEKEDENKEEAQQRVPARDASGGRKPRKGSLAALFRRASSSSLSPTLSPSPSSSSLSSAANTSSSARNHSEAEASSDYDDDLDAERDLAYAAAAEGSMEMRTVDIDMEADDSAGGEDSDNEALTSTLPASPTKKRRTLTITAGQTKAVPVARGAVVEISDSD